MSGVGGEKSFDVMKWSRATRAEIYEETKDMSFEEERRWTEERIGREPHLAMLYDRRRVPVGGRNGPDDLRAGSTVPVKLHGLIKDKDSAVEAIT